MGLFDKLKEAGKGLMSEVQKMDISVTLPCSQKQAEAARKEEIEKAHANYPPYAEAKAQAEADCIEKAIHTCENGRCAFYNEKSFVFSCPKSCTCPKKVENLAYIKLISDPEMLDYAFEVAKAFACKTGVYYKGIALRSCDNYKNSSSATEDWKFLYDAVLDNFIDKYFPKFKNCPKMKEHIFWLAFKQPDSVPTFSEENETLAFTKAFHDKLQANPEIKPPKNKLHTYYSAVYCSFIAKKDTTPLNDEPYIILRDMSIFTLEPKIFQYVVRCLNLVFSAVAKEFKETGSTTIPYELMYESDMKHLKRIGFGGPKVGEDGDTFYNAVHSEELSGAYERVTDTYDVNIYKPTLNEALNDDPYEKF